MRREGGSNHKPAIACPLYPCEDLFLALPSPCHPPPCHGGVPPLLLEPAACGLFHGQSACSLTKWLHSLQHQSSFLPQIKRDFHSTASNVIDFTRPLVKNLSKVDRSPESQVSQNQTTPTTTKHPPSVTVPRPNLSCKFPLLQVHPPVPESALNFQRHLQPFSAF